MTLTELRAEVVTLTNRPDLDVSGQILLAVRRATLKLHSVDYFYRDISEFPVIFGSSSNLQDIDILSVIPRYRSAKYFRFLDASVTPNVPGRFLKKVDSQNILDSYSIEQENVWYQGGDVIHFRYETAFQYLLAGVYLFPDITVATYTSWIAVSYPYAIVLEAAATIFKMIGKADEARMTREDNIENISLLRISGIQENPEVDL